LLFSFELLNTDWQTGASSRYGSFLKYAKVNYKVLKFTNHVNVENICLNKDYLYS